MKTHDVFPLLLAVLASCNSSNKTNSSSTMFAKTDTPYVPVNMRDWTGERDLGDTLIGYSALEKMISEKQDTSGRVPYLHTDPVTVYDFEGNPAKDTMIYLVMPKK